MHRRAAATLMAMCVLASVAQAQRTGEPNPALRQATVSPASLGSGERAFAQYSMTDRNNEWIAALGVGFGDGMLWGSYGHGPTQRIYSLGYGLPLVGKSLGLFGTLGAGVDLQGAFDDNTAYSYKSRAARLAIPLSWRLGSPSAVSLTPYVAPYAEIGRAYVLHGACTIPPGNCDFSPDQTRSVGLGWGFDLTAWRLGANFGMMGVPVRLNLYGPWTASAGVRLRF